jgi:hypothetical protein
MAYLYRHEIGKSNSKSVLQFDKQNNFIQEYISVTEAKKQTKIPTIDRAARGKIKTSGGYIWKYKIK